MRNKTNITLILILVLCSLSVKSQLIKTDSLKGLVLNSYKNDPYDNHKDVLRYSTELYYLSKNKNNNDIMFSLFEQSRIYFMENKYEIALKKIKEGIALSKKEKEYNMLCRFTLIYHNILVQLGLPKESKNALQQAIKVNKLVANNDDRHLNNVYIEDAKANSFVNNEGLSDDLNKVIELKKKAYIQSTRINSENPLKNFTQIYALQSLSWSCALARRFDESYYYLKKTDSLLTINPNYYFNLDVLITKGAIANIERNHKKAVQYFEEVIDKSENTQSLYKLYSVYPMISAAYGEMGDFKSATHYSWKFKNLNDYMQKLRVDGSNIAIINNINKELSEKAMTFNWKYLHITSICVIIIFLILFFYKKRIKKTSEVVTEIHESEEQSNRDIDSDIHKYLIVLAKEDINAFYIEFNKCYPEFHDQLKHNFPELNLMDIDFCSLIKMRFDIKQIAIYTNSSLRSVESRRYRIRKKMNLPGQDDLYMYISNLEKT